LQQRTLPTLVYRTGMVGPRLWSVLFLPSLPFNGPFSRNKLRDQPAEFPAQGAAKILRLIAIAEA
jgi:hypothetical protein